MEEAREVCGVGTFSEWEEESVCYFVAEGYYSEGNGGGLEGIAGCEGVVVDLPCEVIYGCWPTGGKFLFKSASPPKVYFLKAYLVRWVCPGITVM